LRGFILGELWELTDGGSSGNLDKKSVSKLTDSLFFVVDKREADAVLSTNYTF
jgi:hypothetical protein